MLRPSTFWVFFLAFTLRAETFSGKVVDPSGAAIPGARVAAVNRVGVVVSGGNMDADQIAEIVSAGS